MLCVCNEGLFLFSFVVAESMLKVLSRYEAHSRGSCREIKRENELGH
jgi:hypothetical protein